MGGHWRDTIHVRPTIQRPISIGPMSNELFMLMSLKSLIPGPIAGIIYIFFLIKIK